MGAGPKFRGEALRTSEPQPRWRVYSADGERVTDWAAVLAAPTLASLGRNSSDTPAVGEGAVAGGGRGRPWGGNHFHQLSNRTFSALLTLVQPR